MLLRNTRSFLLFVLAVTLFAATAAADPACTYTVTPVSAVFPAAGESLTATVTVAGTGCAAWTATSGAAWVTLSNLDNASNPGKVTFTAAAGTAARTGTITVAGQDIAVSQLAPTFAGAPPGYRPEFFGVQAFPSAGTGLSNDGRVVGVYVAANRVRGFLRNVDKTLTLIDVPGALNTYPLSVNASGVVVGYFDSATISRGFLRNPDGSFLTFDINNATATSIVAINDAGQMVGTITNGVNVQGVKVTNALARGADLSRPPQGFNNPQSFAASFADANGANLVIELSDGSATTALACAASGGLIQIPGTIGLNDAGETAFTCSRSALVSYSTPQLRLADGTQLQLEYASGLNESGILGFQVASGLNNLKQIVGSGTVSGVGQAVVLSPCAVGVDRTTLAVPGSGGGITVGITAGPTCYWAATADVSWIQTGFVATGANPVIQIQPNSTNNPRTGTLTVGGVAITVTQGSAPCAVTLNPTSASISFTGGTVQVGITAAGSCAWSVISPSPWVTIQGATSGTGNGTVTLVVAANPTAPARSSNISIGNQTFTINQAAPAACSYIVNGPGFTFTSAGGLGSITVAAADGCAWTAVSNSSWITITSGSSGMGNGAVGISVAAGTGARTGTLTVAGSTVTINQAAPVTQCATMSQLKDIPADGISGTLAISAPSTCSWEVVSAVPWAFVTPTSGKGPATITYVVQPNPKLTSREVTLSATFGSQTVLQFGRGSCTLSLAPSGITVDSLGTTKVVTVSGDAGCTWTPTSNATWLTVQGTGNGSASSNLTVTIAQNATGTPRFGTVTVGDQTLAVTQTAATQTAGTRFVPITPCRIMDTRYGQGKTGAFGPSFISGTRAVPVPLSSCNVPGTARAYSLNVTVVPYGALGYLTVWPLGQAQPGSSNLNAPTGAITANAAIVPAGDGGGISVFTSNPTEVIIDINGYFADTTTPNSLAFYPLTPCRVFDTRPDQGFVGVFGPPSMPVGGATRTIPMSQSRCAVPANAAAYSLNFTVVPSGKLGYLSAWPAGSLQPLVSTLNSLDGSLLANAAIVPAGADGSISIFTQTDTGTTDVIVDINGYFAPPGQGGLSLYPTSPCRAADTRATQGKTGAFGPPSMVNGETRTFPLVSAGCSVPTTVQAYALNVTAVPNGRLGYLSIWPSGTSQPVVSTLNSLDGRTVANAAIVPAGSSGSVSVYTDSAFLTATNVILDIFGYFAP